MSENKTCTLSEDVLQILDYTGEGYFRTMNFGAWRVANLNWADRFDVRTDAAPEQHFLTDEVFVLLTGRAFLEVWDPSCSVRESCPQDVPAAVVGLDPYKIYNVRKGIYHRFTVEPGTRTLVIENHDTSLDNTRYMKDFAPKHLTLGDKYDTILSGKKI